MNKVKYNKKTKCYERTIIINGIQALCSHKIERILKELPCELTSPSTQKTSGVEDE